MKFKSTLNLPPPQRPQTPKTRLHGCPLPIVALTGSIATGKTSASRMIREYGLNVICADSLIHDIYQEEETLAFIKKTCPGALHNNEISFPALRKFFFDSKDLRHEIESFLYARLPSRFLQKITPEDQVIIYDIPLLYEKGLEKEVDLHGVVYATKANQRKRLIERDKFYDPDTLEKTIQLQTSIEEKKRRAQFIIDNNQDREHLKSEVDKFIRDYFTID